MVKYIPKRGDLVWIDFSPQKGHEQAGKRPAFVLSPTLYNSKTGLMIALPITSKEKGYPFEVKLDNLPVNGVVLCDQIKSLDYKARNIKFICHCSDDIIEEILAKVRVLI